MPQMYLAGGKTLLGCRSGNGGGNQRLGIKPNLFLAQKKSQNE